MSYLSGCTVSVIVLTPLFSQEIVGGKGRWGRKKISKRGGSQWKSVSVCKELGGISVSSPTKGFDKEEKDTTRTCSDEEKFRDRPSPPFLLPRKVRPLSLRPVSFRTDFLPNGRADGRFDGRVLRSRTICLYRDNQL